MVVSQFKRTKGRICASIYQAFKSMPDLYKYIVQDHYALAACNAHVCALKKAVLIIKTSISTGIREK